MQHYDFHASVPRGGGVAGKHGLGQQHRADLCEFAVFSVTVVEEKQMIVTEFRTHGSY